MNQYGDNPSYAPPAPTPNVHGPTYSTHSCNGPMTRFTAPPTPPVYYIQPVQPTLAPAPALTPPAPMGEIYA